MLQDIAPHIYHHPMSFLPPAPGDLALAYAGGNRALAARLLGISRTALYQKLERFRLY